MMLIIHMFVLLFTFGTVDLLDIEWRDEIASDYLIDGIYDYNAMMEDEILSVDTEYAFNEWYGDGVYYQLNDITFLHLIYFLGSSAIWFISFRSIRKFLKG